MAIAGWPVAADYDEAIQNPHLNFADGELKSGEVEYDKFGSPAVRSGNFASVYMVSGSSRKAAVRCFLREIADQNERYAAISHDLLGLQLPYTVNFEFVPQGIKVQDSWFPILKMDWCDGELLDEYIERNLLNPVKLRRLSDKWFEMSVALRKEGMAHGDLQHGNVIIQDDEIKLIDYDGMFVPRLAGRKSNERGLEHYQHPGRTDNHFGRYLDNFSHWVIYTTIYALSMDKSLWRYVNIEDKHMLFSKKDFESPDTSEVFAILKRHEDPTVRTYATTVENLLQYDVDKIPEFHPDKPILYPPEKPAARGGDRGNLFEPKKEGGDRGNLFNGQTGSDRGNLFSEEKGGDKGRLFEGEQKKPENQLVKDQPKNALVAEAQRHPVMAALAGIVTLALLGVGAYLAVSLSKPTPSASEQSDRKAYETIGALINDVRDHSDALNASDMDSKLSDLKNSVPANDAIKRSRAETVKGASLWVLGAKTNDKGKQDAAIDAFRTATTLDDTNSDAWFALGKAYEAKGDMQRAKDSWDKAKKVSHSPYWSADGKLPPDDK